MCNERYYRIKGYKVYWKSPNQVSCIECRKLTSSVYSACRKHAGKYHIREFYQQRKLAKIQASDGLMPG